MVDDPDNLTPNVSDLFNYYFSFKFRQDTIPECLTNRANFTALLVLDIQHLKTNNKIRFLAEKKICSIIDNLWYSHPHSFDNSRDDIVDSIRCL